jgi:hypothetical protein
MFISIMRLCLYSANFILFFIFIVELFNYAFSCQDYIVLNDRMTSE